MHGNEGKKSPVSDYPVPVAILAQSCYAPHVHVEGFAYRQTDRPTDGWTGTRSSLEMRYRKKNLTCAAAKPLLVLEDTRRARCNVLQTLLFQLCFRFRFRSVLSRLASYLLKLPTRYFRNKQECASS